MKLLLLFTILFYPILSFSSIDIYFANGIKTEEFEASENAEILELAILKITYRGNISNYNKQIAKVSYAYNNTHGFGSDILESLLQKIGWNGLTDLLTEDHKKDLSKQIIAYKESLDKGRNVLTVAHSQGNLFTYEAFEAIKNNNCDAGNLKAISVASPMSADIQKNTPRIDWDNDLVARIASFGFSVNDIESKVRSVMWEDIYEPEDVEEFSDSPAEPKAEYVHVSNLGSMYNSYYRAQEGGINSTVHSFEFYMGINLKDANGKTIYNPFDGKVLIDTQAKDAIMLAIKNVLDSNKNTVSKSGVIETTLSWNYGSDINMDLDMQGPNVHHDIKDVEGVAREHAYVESAFDVKPGDMFELYATGNKLDDSELQESCLDTQPVKIYAIVKTPSGSHFKQYQAQNFEELNIGKFAEIEVRKKILTTSVCPAHRLFWNAQNSSFDCRYPVKSPSPSRTYQGCTDKEKKSSCGCVPCEYIVRGTPIH